MSSEVVLQMREEVIAVKKDIEAIKGINASENTKGSKSHAPFVNNQASAKSSVSYQKKGRESETETEWRAVEPKRV